MHRDTWMELSALEPPTYRVGIASIAIVARIARIARIVYLVGTSHARTIGTNPNDSHDVFFPHRPSLYLHRSGFDQVVGSIDRTHALPCLASPSRLALLVSSRRRFACNL